MNYNFFLRAISIGAVIACHKVMSLDQQVNLVFCLILSHYFLSFVASRKIAFEKARQWKQIGAASGILFIGMASLIIFDWPIMVFVFGAHHVFNEVYIQQRGMTESSVPTHLRALSVLLEALIYLAATRSDVEALLDVQVDTYAYILPIALVSGTTLLVSIRAGRDNIHIRQNLLYLALGLAGTALSFWTDVSGFDYLLLYHYVWWFFFPLKKMVAEKSVQKISLYLAWNLVLSATVFPLTPLGLNSVSLTWDSFNWLSRVGGYFHILSSLALSNAHPQWIRSRFQGAAPTSQLKSRSTKAA